jgi:hypothetical protein
MQKSKTMFHIKEIMRPEYGIQNYNHGKITTPEPNHQGHAPRDHKTHTMTPHPDKRREPVNRPQGPKEIFNDGIARGSGVGGPNIQESVLLLYGELPREEALKCACARCTAETKAVIKSVCGEGGADSKKKHTTLMRSGLRKRKHKLWVVEVRVYLYNLPIRRGLVMSITVIYVRCQLPSLTSQILTAQTGRVAYKTYTI